MSKLIQVDFLNKEKLREEKLQLNDIDRLKLLDQLDKSLKITLEIICRLHPNDETAQEIFAVELALIKKHVTEGTAWTK